MPNRNITFPAIDYLGWNDISPRLGAVYDLFGNGKTAVKVNLGRYVLAQRLTSDYTNLGNPVNAMANLVTRSWNDRGGLGINGDYIPQCDLTESAGERGVRGAERRAVRPADPQHGVRSGDAPWMEQAAGGLGVRGQRPAPADATGWRGGRLLPSLVWQLHGDRQPGDGTRPTTRSTASPRRSILACPTAAATSCLDSTTSTRTRWGRSIISSPWPATTGTTSSTGTVWTSTSTCGWDREPSCRAG